MRHLAFLLVLAAFCPAALAQTTVTIDATKDNTLFSENGELSNGAGSFLFTGRTSNGALRRALLQFDDLSSVPSGATITSVELILNMSRSVSGTFDVSVHPVTADWGEGASDASGQEGGGAAAQAGDATWTSRFLSDQLWTNAGGDFESTSVTSAAVGGTGTYTFASTSALVALVNDWIANPTDNFGVLLLTNENSVSAKRFNSRENAAGSPQLRVTFEVGAETVINPSGLWFTPSVPGDGFNVVNSSSASGDLLTFFFFGYSDNGERLWLVSDTVDTRAILGQTISVNVFDGPLNEGTFSVPPSGLLNWGTLDITFLSCTEGNYTLNGVDGIKSAGLALLAPLAGLVCDDGS